jgi:Undecaprenyl-phosphate galactose phosphotransferase WbaP
MTPQSIELAQLSVFDPSSFAIKERKWVSWVLLLSDVVALEFALLLGHFLRLALLGWWPVHIGPSQFHGLALGLLFIPAGYQMAGLYPGYGLGPVEKLRARLKVTFSILGGLIIWDYLIQHGTWSRGILLVAAVFALVLPPLIESGLVFILIRTKNWGTPVVVLGATRTGVDLVERLRRKRYLGLIPVAVLDDDHAEPNHEHPDVPVIGPLSMADWFLDRVHTVVVAMPRMGQARLGQLLQDLSFPRVIVIPDFSDLQSQWITPLDMGGTLGLELKRNLLLGRNWMIKRLLDYILVIPLFLFSLPIIGLLAVWIKKVSPGPAFYTQEREGYDGRMLRVWKLRTMYPNAEQILDRHLERSAEAREEWRRFFKLKNDPRILPGVGHFLRKTSLDELPQLWNVLKGEMSLVGPRPFPAYHLDSFDTEFRRLRRRVLPGMTGLWQVSERSNGDLTVQRSLDTYYIRNWSIWQDIYLLVSTLRAVLLSRGAY